MPRLKYRTTFTVYSKQDFSETLRVPESQMSCVSSIDYRAPRGLHLFVYQEEGGFNHKGLPSTSDSKSQLRDAQSDSDVDCCWELVGEDLQKQGVIEKLKGLFFDDAGILWPECKLVYHAEGAKVVTRFTLYADDLKVGEPTKYSYLFGKRDCCFNTMCHFIESRDLFFPSLDQMLEHLWVNHLQSSIVELFAAFSRYHARLAAENKPAHIFVRDESSRTRPSYGSPDLKEDTTKTENPYAQRRGCTWGFE